MRRYLHMACALAVAMATVLVASHTAPPARAAPLPSGPITWTPASLELTIASGSSSGAAASFVSSSKLSNLTISAVGRISGFVVPSPSTLPLITGTPSGGVSTDGAAIVLVNLAVVVPSTTALGYYRGRIEVSAQSWPTAASLPITIHVIAPTAGHIYFTGGSAGIDRTDLDGEIVETGFIRLQYPPDTATCVAVNAQYVYWTDETRIGRANLDGSNPNPSFIVLPYWPDPIHPGGWYKSSLIGIAVNAQHIYWTDADAQVIGRANLDGSGVQQFFMSTGAGSLPYAVAVDAAHIYWTEQISGSIGRANLDGTIADWSFMGVGATPIGLAIDAQHIYWTWATGGSPSASFAMGRANLDGSNPNPNFITGDVMTGVAVDGQHIFWANIRLDNFRSIGRANLDGSNPISDFVLTSAFFLALGS